MTDRADHPTDTVANTVAGDVSGSLIQAGVVEGGIHQYYGTRRHVIEKFPVVTPPDAGWLMDQPSRLLDARNQVVPFIGREAELSRLREWRDSGAARLSVLLLHAPGGQGKTRLAAEFAEHCRSRELPAAQRWHVLQAGFHRTPTGSTDAPEGAGAGILLIVDYADRWAHSELARLFTDPLLQQPLPTRVLLVGRTVRWFAAVRAELGDHHAAVGDLLLSPLAAGRFSMFAAARDRYGEPDLYDLPDTADIQPPGSLDHRDFGLTLTLQMAALVAVDAHARGEQPPSEPHELSAYLLDREYRAWQRLFDAGSHGQDYRTRPAVMAKAVFTAVLTGAVGHDTGTQALRKLDLPGHPQDLLLDHRFCYPPADRDLVLDPLYPDRLAEDFVALFTPGHHISAYDPDPWASGAPTTLLTTDELRATVAARAVTVLASVAERWPHVGQKVLFPLLRAEPSLALEAGTPALVNLADIADIPDDVLEPIARLLPEGRHVDLDIGAAAITETLATRALATTTDPAIRARWYAHCSWRLAAAGRAVEALQASQHAVDLHHTLAASDLAAHLPLLVMLMRLHSSRLADAGQWADALTYAHRAAYFFGELAEVDRVAYLPFLATSTNHLALALKRAGQHAKALAMSRHAVDLMEEVVESNHAADHLADRASGLTTYALMLGEAGQSTKALAYSQYAVDLNEELVAGDRAANLPGLATSLHNHASRLEEVGRDAEALAVSERAIDLFEELVAGNRAYHLHLLAGTLDNHSGRLAKAGRRREALTVAQRAVDLNEELVAGNRAAHLPGLAHAVGGLAKRLADAGRLAEALVFSEHAVEYYSELAAANRAVHLPDLMRVVNNHALLLGRAEQWPEAFAFSQRTVELYEELAETDRVTHLPGLAAAVSDHAARLAGAERPGSLAFSQRAVELYEELATGDRVAHLPDLAAAVSDHAYRMAWAGRPDSLVISQRAVELYEELATADPVAYLPDLADSSRVFAAARVLLRTDLDAAERVGVRAVDLYRTLADGEPEMFSTKLHYAVITLAEVLNALGRAEEAARIRNDLDGEPPQIG